MLLTQITPKMVHFNGLGAQHFDTHTAHPCFCWLSGPTCFSSTTSCHIHVASWGASTEPGKTRVQQISWTYSYLIRVDSILIPCRLIDCTNFGTPPWTATLLISVDLGELCFFFPLLVLLFAKKDAAAGVSGCTA